MGRFPEMYNNPAFFVGFCRHSKKKKKLAHFLKTFNPCQSFPSVAIVNRKRPKYKLE